MKPYGLFISFILFFEVLLSSCLVAQSQDSSEPPILLQKWHRIKSEFREALAPARDPIFRFELLMPLEAQKNKPFEYQDLPERIVLVLGGLQTNSNAPETFASLLRSEVQSGSEVAFAVFNYPNDGPIEESGKELRSYLQTIQTNAPKTRIAITSHSMGGLVARYAMEVHEDQSGPEVKNVDRLIMICPPNHGSALAQYADALEIADFMSKCKEQGFSLDTFLEAFVHDGMGEACDDLVPGSKCLNLLNSKPRAADVRYAIAIGTGGPISPAQRLLTSVLVSNFRSKLKADTPRLKWLLEKGEELLNCDELTSGLGDGAVSLTSARLEGVQEREMFAIHHIDWLDVNKKEVKRMLKWVAAQIKKQ